jgi:K+-sensing histidine kinase KdpD
MERSPIHVLLVEDNRIEARLLEVLLNESVVAEFQVVTADRLSTALNLLAQQHFDVILLDLSLPDTTGMDTFRKLQSAVPHLPVVVLTGLEDEQIAGAALYEGAQDYLTKQFSDGRLIERAIRYAIQRKQAEQERLHLIREQAEQTKQLQIEQSARREAEKANELKMLFLAMISHELRTPLTSIKGFVTTLLADDVEWDAESQHRFLGIVEEETDKLTDLVDQLLDLARLHAGTLRINATARYLSDILHAAAAQLEMLSRDHSLMVDLPLDLPPVMADLHRVAQVFTNLVGNAARYAPSHTSIHIGAQVLADQVQIDVRDEGPGIPPDQREVIFEAFRQVERKHAGQKGAGLGLAICKGIVESHGGRIWIQGNTYPGTVVSFTLPIARITLPVRS